MSPVADAFHDRSIRVAEAAVALRFVGGATGPAGGAELRDPLLRGPVDGREVAPCVDLARVPAHAKTAPLASGPGARVAWTC